MKCKECIKSTNDYPCYLEDHCQPAGPATRFVPVSPQVAFDYKEQMKEAKAAEDKHIDDLFCPPIPPIPSKLTSDGSTASYYQLPAGATELQQLISHRDMNAQIGEIFRACYRYGIASHSDKLRDAKKIKFYAEAEIARLEKLEMERRNGN